MKPADFEAIATALRRAEQGATHMNYAIADKERARAFAAALTEMPEASFSTFEFAVEAEAERRGM